MNQENADNINIMTDLENINSSIDEFREKYVYEPWKSRDEVLYHDPVKGTSYFLRTSGDEPYLHQYIKDQCIEYALYLSVNNDRIPLITWFEHIESGSMMKGPAKYLYPDGKLAAIEYHSICQDYDENIKDYTFRSYLEDWKSSWFSPDGKSIKKENFDCLFLKNLAADNLEEIYPHYKYYNNLVDKFCNSIVKPDLDFAELDSLRYDFLYCPDELLEWIEDRIRKRIANSIDQEMLDRCVHQYVYRFVDCELLVKKVSMQLLDFETKHVKNPEHCEVFESHSNGQKICKYGDFQYEQVGCYEISNKYKYVEVWQDGLKVSAGFTTSNSYGEYKIGPHVSFYPDGNVHKILKYCYAGDFETDIIFQRCYDSTGRVTYEQKADSDFKKQWDDVRKDAKLKREKKENFDCKQIAKTYQRLCSKTNADLLASRRVKRK